MNTETINISFFGLKRRNNFPSFCFLFSHLLFLLSPRLFLPSQTSLDSVVGRRIHPPSLSASRLRAGSVTANTTPPPPLHVLATAVAVEAVAPHLLHSRHLPCGNASVNHFGFCHHQQTPHDLRILFFTVSCDPSSRLRHRQARVAASPALSLSASLCNLCRSESGIVCGQLNQTEPGIEVILHSSLS